MIPRYTRPEMAAIWEPENRYSIWLQIEILACEALNRLGRIPDEALKVISEKAAFDVDRIDEIEREVKHDVIAFLTSVAEKVGPDSRYIHLGMTSSDVLDTSFAVQMVQAADLILEGLANCRDILRMRAEETRDMVMMGRSHGVHAEPTTFGLKMALWYEELGRAEVRIVKARDTVAVGKLSGAVGTYAALSPDVESYVCEKLGLSPAKVTTQVIQRDRHAEYITAMALAASSIEKFAVEIRHLQRTEVGEVSEPFTKGQKGSSAMPHKKNPILSENLTGLSRLLRGYCLTAMENIPLWHERDISHSSAERVIFPDTTIVLDFMIHRFAGMMEGLVVYPERMKANMEISGGTTCSQKLLLALVDSGISREDAYAIVQRNAHSSLDSDESFEGHVKKDPDVISLLDNEALASVFGPADLFAGVKLVFDRVFSGEE
ncbi:MAG: adenylosuccinate lyase [bacterium]